MDTRLRALVASEPPQVRHFLVDALERQPGVVVVGQADNAIKAMGLARRLRPEVVLVDFELPQYAGFDSIPLTRASGLDTAMVISQELGKSKVLLLTNLGQSLQQESATGGEMESYLYTGTADSSRPIELWKLWEKGPEVEPLIFASLGTREQAQDSSRIIEISEKVVAYSGLALMGGLGLMVTLILAGAGAALAAAGAVGIFLGLAIRVVGGQWLKRRAGPVENGQTRQKWLKAVPDDGETRSQGMPDI